MLPELLEALPTQEAQRRHRDFRSAHERVAHDHAAAQVEQSAEHPALPTVPIKQEHLQRHKGQGDRLHCPKRKPPDFDPQGRQYHPELVDHQHPITPAQHVGKEVRADHSLRHQKIGKLAKASVVIVLPTIDQCGEQTSSGQREGNTWKDSRAWFFGHGEQVLRKVRFRDGGYFR